MLHENTFEKVYFNGSKGLVFLDDLMLVYRRDYNTTNLPGYLDLPGGGREGDESPFEAFRREVKEEFGILIQKDEIDFSCTIPSVMEPGKKSYFLVAKTKRFTSKDVIFGDEGSEWMLMTAEEFIGRSDGIDRQQKRVAKYLAGELFSE